jgi:hypothetical protein
LGNHITPSNRWTDSGRQLRSAACCTSRRRCVCCAESSRLQIVLRAWARCTRAFDPAHCRCDGFGSEVERRCRQGPSSHGLGVTNRSSGDRTRQHQRGHRLVKRACRVILLCLQQRWFVFRQESEGGIRRRMRRQPGGESGWRWCLGMGPSGRVAGTYGARFGGPYHGLGNGGCCEVGEAARILFDAAARDDQHKYSDRSLLETGRGSSRAASGGPPPLEIPGRGGWATPGVSACEYSGRPPNTNSHQPSLRPAQHTMVQDQPGRTNQESRLGGPQARNKISAGLL